MFLSLIPNFLWLSKKSASETSILVCIVRKEVLSIINCRNCHKLPIFGYAVFKTRFIFEIDFKRLHNIRFILSTIVGFMLLNYQCIFLKICLTSFHLVIIILIMMPLRMKLLTSAIGWLIILIIYTLLILWGI